MKTLNYKKVKENITFGIIMFLMLYVLITLVAFTIHAAEVKNNAYTTAIESDKNGLYNGFEVEPAEGDTIHIYYENIVSFSSKEDGSIIIIYNNADQNIFDSKIVINKYMLAELIDNDSAYIPYKRTVPKQE